MDAPLGKLFSILACIFALVAVYLTTPSLCPKLCSSTSPRSATENLHSGYFGYECAGRPHHSSWSTWWHPERSDGVPAEHKMGAGAITRDWNILYHLGGNGPWVEKVIDVVDGGIAVPKGCAVEQMHMVGLSHSSLKSLHRITDVNALSDV